MSRLNVTALAAALVAAVVSAVGCESREGMMRKAEERADRWGYPAVHVVHDVVYADYGQRQLRLDVYRPPRQTQALVPGIIVVRGGAWRNTDKLFLGYVAGQLAAAGFVAASIEYRPSTEAKFPAALQDVKAAVRWLRAHAASYGVDPGAIGAIGGSAGAHLVAMLGTTDGVADFEGTGGNAGVSSHVQAVVAMGGGYDLRSTNVGPQFVSAVTDFVGAPLAAHADAVAAASPVLHVSRHSAPLLLLHSDTDPLAPVGQAVEMARAYKRMGAFVQLKIIDAPGVHGFWGDSRYWVAAREVVVDFFRKQLRQSISPARSTGPRSMRIQMLPGGDLVATAAPLSLLLHYAYDVPINPSPRLSGAPEWRDRYDIEAKAHGGMQAALRAMLADRFKLVMRVEQKTTAAYALRVASGGLTLPKAAVGASDCTFDTASPDSCHTFVGETARGHPMHAHAVTMDDLAVFLENWTDLPVVNRTGVGGLFAIETEGWKPMRLPPPPPGPVPPISFDDLPTIFTVLRTLGLDLKQEQASVPVYTVEHIERPTQ